MTDLTVRKLLIDLETPIPARWNGGDAFRSAFFSALSMSFPVGEQYFIDSLRAGVKALPAAKQEGLANEVQAFVGQEATHRRIHTLFNAHLDRQGFVNTVGPRALRRMQSNAHLDVRIHVAATAATEHITAMFADWMLRYHAVALADVEPRLVTLWLWHSAEETEHRSTAFDVYRALGGNHAWRVKVFKVVTWLFLSDMARQTVRNLWHDGSLWRWSTWRSAWALLLSEHGMLRGNFPAWKAYLRPGFHPRQQDDALATAWLQDNRALYTPVGSLRETAAA